MPYRATERTPGEQVGLTAHQRAEGPKHRQRRVDTRQLEPRASGLHMGSYTGLQGLWAHRFTEFGLGRESVQPALFDVMQPDLAVRAHWPSRARTAWHREVRLRGPLFVLDCEIRLHHIDMRRLHRCLSKSELCEAAPAQSFVFFRAPSSRSTSSI